MSDPFVAQEADSGITKRVLRTLAEFHYPTVVSTKSDLFRRADYLDVLSSGNFFLQVSFSTLDTNIAAAIERGTPSPQDRLAAIAEASAAGLSVSVRHQPVLPGHETEMARLIRFSAEAGAVHYSAEFLKLGIEKSDRQQTLFHHLPLLANHYTTATRSGREWLLPPEQRLQWLLDARDLAHKNGMSFGAADTDLLPLSDGAACCSGADLHLPDPGRPFLHNYLGAIRNSNGRRISYQDLASEWRPERSLARFVNSDSRITGKAGAGVSAYIQRNWNGRSNGPSPEMFYGVTATDEFDSAGFRHYDIAPWLAAELCARIQS